MRSWYVKGKGLAPGKCRPLDKGDWLFALLVGGPVALIALVYAVFC